MKFVQLEDMPFRGDLNDGKSSIVRSRFETPF